MRLVMDRLFEALTQLDVEIRKQLKQPCTLGGLRDLQRLETARADVRHAQITLCPLDDGVARAAGASSSVPSSSTG